ncbi:MAG: CHAT domain-containing protein, partial [Gemmatimonadaceae bacterium]
VLDSAVAALVLTRSEVKLLSLPEAPAAARAALTDLYAALPPRLGSRVDRRRGRFNSAAAERLFRILLEPVIGSLAWPERLTVIPDGYLHLVPWDALTGRMPNGDRRFVAEQSTVSVITSLRDAAAPDEPLPSLNLLAVGGPDPDRRLAVARELDAIRSAWRGRPFTRLEGAGANEAAVRDSLPTAGILHFAAHAEPNAVSPDRAVIQLADGPGEDGRLHAFELPALGANGVLVVLSACESGTGRTLQGEGPLSIGRAFLRAGARQVMVTLWPVGEQSIAVIEDFYQNLARGESAAAALRAAKLAAWRRGLDPLDWSVFTLVSRKN